MKLFTRSRCARSRWRCARSRKRCEQNSSASRDGCSRCSESALRSGKCSVSVGTERFGSDRRCAEKASHAHSVRKELSPVCGARARAWIVARERGGRMVRVFFGFRFSESLGAVSESLGADRSFSKGLTVCSLARSCSLSLYFSLPQATTMRATMRADARAHQQRAYH